MILFARFKGGCYLITKNKFMEEFLRAIPMALALSLWDMIEGMTEVCLVYCFLDTQQEATWGKLGLLEFIVWGYRSTRWGRNGHRSSSQLWKQKPRLLAHMWVEQESEKGECWPTSHPVQGPSPGDSTTHNEGGASSVDPPDGPRGLSHQCLKCLIQSRWQSKLTITRWLTFLS